MKTLHQRISICLILILFIGCKKDVNNLIIEALPVDARITGNILVGPSVLNDSNRFVWGASVIKGNDGKYHMLFNTWECGDSIPEFSNSWVLYSKIGYATSDYPDRNFKFRKIVMRGRTYEGNPSAWDAQMVTNPHIKRFDDKYYLYYVGSVDPGVQPAGSMGENVNKRNRVQQSQKIGVIEFSNFNQLLSGEFVRPDKPLLSPRTRVKDSNIVSPSPKGTETKPDNIIVVNPSVVKRPSDGKYLLYFKGNLYDPHWKGVHGVAIANSPMGPFTATDEFVFDIKLDDGKLASAEDPYVWFQQSHECFYAVVKDFTGKITGGEPGLALLESTDGISWEKSENSYFMKKEVNLLSGETVKVTRLERPQILLDENSVPSVLYCACSIININPTKDGESFNVHIPLKIK